MSYIDIGKDYEDKYLDKLIDPDPSHEFVLPCFEESCEDVFLQKRVSNRINEVYDKPEMNFYVLSCIFAQYLYDQYSVLPEDLEFMCSALLQGTLDEIGRAAKKVMEDALPGNTHKVTTVDFVNKTIVDDK